jgi:hypothetical protein
VQDPFEHVDICCYGLRVEEVVRLEGYAIAEFGWEFFFEDRSNFGEILHDDFEIREFAGEDGIVVACRAAELLSQLADV